MASNVSTIFTADGKQYERTIKDMKKTTKGFEKDIKDTSKSISGGMMQMAGSFGIAVGAGEAFSKFLGSSQTISDAWDKTIASTKASVDEFFYALGSGDFSMFLNGMDDIIVKARQTAAVLDQLGNTQMSYKFFSGKYDASIADAKVTLLDKNATKEQKQAAKAQLEKALQEKRIAAETLKNDGLKGAIALASQGTPLKNISAKDIEYTAKIDLLPDEERRKAKEKYATEYQQYIKDVESINKKYNVSVAGSNSKGEIEANKVSRDAQLARAAEKYRKSIIVNNLLVKKNDESWQKVLDTLSNVDLLNQQIANDQRAANRAMNQADAGSGGNKGNNGSSAIFPKNTLADYRSQITALNKQLEIATTDSARQAIQGKIDLLKATINEMEITARGFKGTSVSTSDGNYRGGLKVMADPTKGLGKIQSPFNKQNVKINTDYADSLNAIAGAMGTLNAAMDGGNKTFLSFAAVSGAAIAQMIIQLQALCTAKGVSSAFSLPFPASLAAVATVISTVASVFSALPKFATGGIVPGVAYSGDTQLARVNSGEMILNRSQQSNLFNMINNGSAGNGGNVTFTIKGSDLVGTLNTYLKRKGRV